MSDDLLEIRAERKAELAKQLLLSAKDDGLSDNKLAALGARLFQPKPPSSPKFPFAAMLVLGGLVAIGGAVFYARGPAHHTAPVNAVVAPIASTRTDVAPSETSPVTIAHASSVDVGLLPDAPPPPRAHAEVAPPTARASSSAAPVVADDLPAELLALERVHQAVVQSRVADARSRLAEYERTFPKKLLAQEARVLEIEVLLAEGRRDEAEARAQRFLTGNGADGPYAARVRSLIARPRTP